MEQNIDAGFFQTRFVFHTKLEYPQLWTCNHGCLHAIQLVNNATKKVELELCELHAEKIASSMLDHIDKAARFTLEK